MGADDESADDAGNTDDAGDTSAGDAGAGDTGGEGLPTWARASRATSTATAPPPTSGLPLGAPGREIPSLDKRPPDRLAGLTWLYRYVVIGALSLLGASLLRRLDGWDDGKYWMLGILLIVVAGVCSLLAVIVGVGAVGEGMRYRGVAKGQALASIGLVLAVALGVATVLRATDDWNDVDVPAAVDRLQIGGEEGFDVTGQENTDELATTIKADDLRQRAQAGECYDGDLVDPGERIDCADRHRLEVLAVVTIESDDATLGNGARRELAAELCEDELSDLGSLPAEVDSNVVVPADLTWKAGDRRSLCVAESEVPRRGAVGS